MTRLPIDPAPASRCKAPRDGGFSLIEMSIVLVVFGLLSAGLLNGLSAYREQAQVNEARQQLARIRDALLGFVLINGRLPCPADPALNSTSTSPAGLEAVGAGDLGCSLRQGVLPWQTLGLEEIDPWGNRFTYFADKAFSQPLTQAEKDAGVRNRITLDSEASATIQDKVDHNILTKLPAVVVSHGRNGTGATGANGLSRPTASGEEAENADSDLTFISHPPDDSFDDLLLWLPATVIKARLASVGKLP